GVDRVPEVDVEVVVLVGDRPPRSPVAPEWVLLTRLGHRRLVTRVREVDRLRVARRRRRLEPPLAAAGVLADDAEPVAVGPVRLEALDLGLDRPVGGV